MCAVGPRTVAVVLALAPLVACRSPAPSTKGLVAPPVVQSAQSAGDGAPPGLLACLGAPSTATFRPRELDGRARPGLEVHTFEQETSDCGKVERRYLSYVPGALEARSSAPVLIVLHGQGASAEAMQRFQTRGTFDQLADRERFIVVYGNGLPTRFNLDGLPNSGRWRSEYTELATTVDEIDYLQRIVQDLVDRDVIAGGNDVYLVGQSNGGGMALSAARRRPDAFAGVAAFMPFVGFSPSAPDSLRDKRLRRVLFAYSLEDPMLPKDYAHRVLEPLTRAWATALGVSADALKSPAVTELPDRVAEGATLAVDGDALRATRNSTAQRIDHSTDGAALRVLRFDRAGHFWPTFEHSDPLPVLLDAGLRNQDVEGALEVWRFFRG